MLTAILQIINLALPLATSVVMEIRKNHATGEVSIIATVSQSSSVFDADLAQANKFLAENPPSK